MLTVFNRYSQRNVKSVIIMHDILKNGCRKIACRQKKRLLEPSTKFSFVKLTEDNLTRLCLLSVVLRLK